ncbi:MAG: YgjP-like metallopeptidase domain-containing protein [Chitinophagales bacterium]
MFRFKKKSTKQTYYFDWQQSKVKLHVYYENRKDSRVSITKTGVHIRLPILLPHFEKERLTQQFVEWAKKRLDEKPELFYTENKRYKNGEILNLYDKNLTLVIERNDEDKNHARIKNGAILISVSDELEDEIYYNVLSKLVYKVLANHYKNTLWLWLNKLNEQHQFGVLKNMSIKNNSSNWGSCSSKGKINISVRLLLAPKEVVEYVLIHELAHLKEQNHSSKFWKLVYDACPNYKQYEKWLKKHAKDCVI